MQSVSRRHIVWLAESGHELVAVHTLKAPGAEFDLPGKHMFVPWPKQSWAGRFSPWKYVNGLRAFSRIVCVIADSIEPELVYAEGPLLDVYLKRPRRRRVPVIFHPHGLEMFQKSGSWLHDAKSRPLRGITRRHAVMSDIVLSQGGKLDQLLVNATGLDRARIRYLPNCYPRELHDLQHERGHAKRFLFVGRDERRKGLHILLHAFESLDEATLCIVGISGRRYRAAANVSFHGEVTDRRKLEEFYKMADFLVLPSFAEGMPTVILEAFAFGLPVIASDVGAVNVPVKDGETGFLVAPGDVAGLSAALWRAASLPPAIYEKMRSTCLSQTAGAFSSASVREALLAIVAEGASMEVSPHSPLF